VKSILRHMRNPKPFLLLALIIAYSSASRGQSGMASSSAGANISNTHLPITASGFVQTGTIVFEDVTMKAGLDAWRHQAGTAEKRFIVEAKGPGVCLFDYDNDGWLDIYLVNGATFRMRHSFTTTTTARLLRWRNLLAP
jgi:enediyne biosynthesis protein E4